jgi:hypothetical protein
VTHRVSPPAMAPRSVPKQGTQTLVYRITAQDGAWPELFLALVRQGYLVERGSYTHELVVRVEQPDDFYILAHNALRQGHLARMCVEHEEDVQ